MRRAAWAGGISLALSLIAGASSAASRLVSGPIGAPLPPGVVLAPPSKVGTRAVRREQTWRGLPVLGRGVVEIPAASLRMLDVAVDLPRTDGPALARGEAIARAQPFTRRALSASDARLVVHTGPRGAKLAWLVTPAVGPFPTSPFVAIDALDGRVLEARERVRRVDALVYRENPVRSAAPELLPLPGPAPGATLTTPVLVARSCVDRGEANVVDIGGTARTVRVCRLEQTATANGDGDFVFPARARPSRARDEADPFAETSVFWHAARLRQFVETAFGAGGPTFQDPPLELVAGLRMAAGIDEGDFELAARADVDLAPFAGAFFLPGVGKERSSAGSTARRAARSGSAKERTSTSPTTATSSPMRSPTR